MRQPGTVRLNQPAPAQVSGILPGNFIETGQEERLRLDQIEFNATAIELHPYWQEVVGLFEVYRQIAHYPDRPVAPQPLALLRPGHQWLVRHRWPTRMPSETR